MKKLTQKELNKVVINVESKNNILKDSKFDIYQLEDMIDFAIQDLKLNEDELSVADAIDVMNKALAMTKALNDNVIITIAKEILSYIEEDAYLLYMDELEGLLSQSDDSSPILTPDTKVCRNFVEFITKIGKYSNISFTFNQDIVSQNMAGQACPQCKELMLADSILEINEEDFKIKYYCNECDEYFVAHVDR